MSRRAPTHENSLEPAAVFRTILKIIPGTVGGTKSHHYFNPCIIQKQIIEDLMSARHCGPYYAGCQLVHITISTLDKV